MGQRTAGDLMFEAYVAEQGYGQVDHEPDLGVGKRPDYVIERDAGRCVVEIKEFAAGSSPFSQSSGSLDSKTLLKPIRGQLREAARKFQPMQDLGLPLVAMLANPRDVALDLSIPNLIYSMYGDLTYTFAVSADHSGATEPGQFVTGRNGRLQADHQYISGVGLLGRGNRRNTRIDNMFRDNKGLSTTDIFRFVNEADARGELPDEPYHAVTLIKTASETAVPVPDLFFDGPDDRVFEFDPDSGAYVQTRGPVVA